MSEIKDQSTTDQIRQVGEKSYDYAAQIEYKKRQVNTLVIGGTTCLYVGLFANQKIAEEGGYSLGNVIFDLVPNQSRNEETASYSRDIQLLNSFEQKADSVLIKQDGHYIAVPIAQEKQEAENNLKTLQSQPEMIQSISARAVDVSMFMLPAIALIVAGMAVQRRQKNTRKKFADFIKSSSDAIQKIDWTISEHTDPKSIANALNEYSTENGLPEFVPPPRKKVFGLFY
jgi:uncharacterized membrane protein YiaA